MLLTRGAGGRCLQSATTSLEPCSTSLNCDGDEILTVFDMLASSAEKVF
jgi:hypothetical protein